MLSAASATQWPAAVEVLNESGRSPFVLIYEHASNYIPAEYHKLGLDDQELARHIAWDIGAANVTRALSKRLDASAFLGGYSRLLIVYKQNKPGFFLKRHGTAVRSMGRTASRHFPGKARGHSGAGKKTSLQPAMATAISFPSLVDEVQAAEQAIGLLIRPRGEIEIVRAPEARAVAEGEAPETIDLDGLPIAAA
jgi:hypothetical protein